MVSASLGIESLDKEMANYGASLDMPSHKEPAGRLFSKYNVVT